MNFIWNSKHSNASKYEKFEIITQIILFEINHLKWNACSQNTFEDIILLLL